IGDGGRTSHAGIAAGDQRLAAGESTGALIALFAVVRTGLHLARKTRPCCSCRLNGGLGNLVIGFSSAVSTICRSLCASNRREWQIVAIDAVSRARALRLAPAMAFPVGGRSGDKIFFRPLETKTGFSRFPCATPEVAPGA